MALKIQRAMAKDGSPEHSKEQATAESQRGAGNKEDRAKNINKKIEQSTPDPQGPYPVHKKRNPLGGREEAHKESEYKDKRE